MQDLNTLIASSSLDGPRHPLFGPDGKLYVSSGDSNEVLVYDGITGEALGVHVAASAGGLDFPHGMVFTAGGELLVCSRHTDEILRYDADGNFDGAFVSSGSGGLDDPANLAFGPDQKLYVISRLTDQILTFSATNGAALGAFASVPGGGLASLEFGPDGDLYVTATFTDCVLRYDVTSGALVEIFAGAGSGNANDPLDNPTGLLFGTDGDLYVMNALANEVLRYDGATGDYLGVFVANQSGELAFPVAAAFDTNGNFLVTSRDADLVLKYQGPSGDSPGEFLGVFGNGVGFTLNSARDINNAGQIVGAGYPLGGAGNYTQTAAYFCTPTGSAIDLGLPGYTAEEATGINDDGDVAGHFLSPADGKYHAFLWSETTGAIDLGTLAGLDTFATAITERSGSGDVQVSGYASTSGGDRAWRYNTATGVMQNLGLISGSSGASRAWDINDAGTATGHASAGTKTHAFTRTISGGMVDLGTLGGNHSYAAGINDLNTVVGMSDTSTKAAQNKFQAFMRTTANGMFKLEPQITNLPGSMQLKIRPTRVSDGGQVIGPGSFDPPGTAFVLTPE